MVALDAETAVGQVRDRVAGSGGLHMDRRRLRHELTAPFEAFFRTIVGIPDDVN